MRQQHHKAAQPAPFHFAGGDKLIDHHLRAVGKVAELRFPQHQRIRLGGGIPVFETQHRLFGQQRVDHHEVRLIRRQVLQRGVSALMPYHAILVVPGGVTMKERAALRILPGQPDRIAFGEQRGISQVFRHPPVQRQFAARHRDTVIDDFLHARLQYETLRHGGQRHGQLLQALQRYRGIHRDVPGDAAL